MPAPRKVFTLGVTSLVIALISNLVAAVPDTSDERYLPLAEGAEWTMNLHITAPDGKELKGTAHRIVKGPVERDGKIYFRLFTTLRPDGLPPQSQEKLVRKDSKGFHTLNISIPGAKEEAEVPLPLKVGLTWETQFPVPAKHTVLAKETITLGDKEYADCFKVKTESKDGQFSEIFWEAPHVGSIKSEFNQGPLKFKLTLRDWKPGKAQEKN